MYTQCLNPVPQLILLYMCIAKKKNTNHKCMIYAPKRYCCMFDNMTSEHAKQHVCFVYCGWCRFDNLQIDPFVECCTSDNMHVWSNVVHAYMCDRDVNGDPNRTYRCYFNFIAYLYKKCVGEAKRVKTNNIGPKTPNSVLWQQQMGWRDFHANVFYNLTIFFFLTRFNIRIVRIRPRCMIVVHSKSIVIHWLYMIDDEIADKSNNEHSQPISSKIKIEKFHTWIYCCHSQSAVTLCHIDFPFTFCVRLLLLLFLRQKFQ